MSFLFKKVLLIEDDPSHAMLIKRALKEFTETVEVADHVAAGVAALTSNRDYELVISDLHLPDTSGVTHVQKIVGQSNFAPVVGLTAIFKDK